MKFGIILGKSKNVIPRSIDNSAVHTTKPFKKLKNDVSSAYRTILLCGYSAKSHFLSHRKQADLAQVNKKEVKLIRKELNMFHWYRK